MPPSILPSFADARLRGVPLHSQPAPEELEALLGELALSSALELYTYARRFSIVIRYEDGTLSTIDDTASVTKLEEPFLHFGQERFLNVLALRYLLYTLVCHPVFFL